MNLVKGDEVEVKEKDDNGWWMIAKDGKEGWAPSNYLKLIEQPVAPPPPPPPPAHRPVPAKPPAAAVGGGAAALAAALNGRNGGSSGVSPSSTPGSSRPSSAIGGRGPPPAIKAKPVIPPKPGAKPAGFGGKPPVPAAHKVAAPVAGGPGKVARPAAAGGQLDLAAALARRAQRIQDDSD
jgi:myosin-1